MSYISRCEDNIFPLSEEKNNLDIALREWVYTRDMYDLGEAVENCELCDHPNIRYQFKIRNLHNDNELLVGSECINNFEIKAISDGGYILDADRSQKKVNRDRRHLVAEASKKRLINTLVELSRKEEKFNINSFIDYVQDRGAFTPNQLVFLLSMLNRNNIKYRASDFKITIHRNREKDQLKSMPEWKLSRLWLSMASSQRKWVIENTGYSLLE